MIQEKPNGLIYRRARRLDPGRMMIEEEWDIEVPYCPLIRNPRCPHVPGRYIIRQLILTDREYEERRPTLFEAIHASGQ